MIPVQWSSVADWMRIVAGEVNPLIDGKLNVSTKTAAYTIEQGDKIILGNATGGPFTVTLPPAAQYEGKQFIIKKTDASANAVTIDGNGSETIDGALTVALSTQYESRTVVSNGSNWSII